MKTCYLFFCREWGSGGVDDGPFLAVEVFFVLAEEEEFGDGGVVAAGDVDVARVLFVHAAQGCCALTVELDVYSVLHVGHSGFAAQGAFNGGAVEYIFQGYIDCAGDVALIIFYGASYI